MLHRITGGGRLAGRRRTAPTDAVDAGVPAAVERVPAVLARAVRAVAADGVRPVTDSRWVTERLAAFQDHRLSGELRTVVDREPPLVFRARAGQWDASLAYRPAAQLYWRPAAGADAAPASRRVRSEQPSDTGPRTDARPRTRRRHGHAEPSAGTPAEAPRALRSGRHVPHVLATPPGTTHPTPQGEAAASGRRLPRWLRAALTSASVPSRRSPARPARAAEDLPLPLTPRHEPRTPDRTTADDTAQGRLSRILPVRSASSAAVPVPGGADPARSGRDGLEATPDPARADADTSRADPQPPARTPAQRMTVPAAAARHSAAAADARPQREPDTAVAVPRPGATAPSAVRPDPAHAAVDTRRPGTRPPTGAPATRPRNAPADAHATSEQGPAHNATSPSAAAPHATGAAAAATAEPAERSARPTAHQSTAVSTERPAAQSSHTGPPVRGTTGGHAVPAPSPAKAVRAAASHSGHGAPLRARSLEHSEAHGLPLAHRLTTAPHDTGAGTAAAEPQASSSENAGVTTAKAARATGTDVPVRAPDLAAPHRQNTATPAAGPSPDARPVSEPESAQAGTSAGADTRSPVRRRNRQAGANAADANANPPSARPAAARTTAPNPHSGGRGLPLTHRPASTQDRGTVCDTPAGRRPRSEEHSAATTAGTGREAYAPAPGPAAPLHVQAPDRPSLDGLPLAERTPGTRPDTRSARPADEGNRPAAGPEAAPIQTPIQTHTPAPAHTHTPAPAPAPAPTDGTNTGSGPAPQSAGTRAVQGAGAPDPGPSAPLRARNPGHPVVPGLPLAPRAATAADEAVRANAPAFGRPDAPAERTGTDRPQPATGPGATARSTPGERPGTGRPPAEPATRAVEKVVHRAAKADSPLPHAADDNAPPSRSGIRSSAAAYGGATQTVGQPHAPYPDAPAPEPAPAPADVTGPADADTRIQPLRPDLPRPGAAEVRAPATRLRFAAAQRPAVGRTPLAPRPGRRPDDTTGSYGALGTTEVPGGGSAPFAQPDPAPVGTGTGAYPVFRAFGMHSPGVRAPAPSGEPVRADVTATVVWGIPPVILDKEGGA